MPINSHVAVWRGFRFRRRKGGVFIADYGDPYSYKQGQLAPRLHRWLEKRMLSKFNHILVPTEIMVSTFEKLKNKSAIHVLPQALNLNAFETAKELSSAKDNVVNLYYAGNFYSDIRNPKELFRHLIDSKLNFVFHVFTNTKDSDNMGILRTYAKQLNTRLVVRHLLPREECIYEMSKGDFLVNVSNSTSNQLPSKLIDYKLTGRPIYSYSPGNFDGDLFNEFMSGNNMNDQSKHIDITSFDISKAIKKIESLKS